ncbi:RNA-directed DNA polymerase from mobile element jockey [Plakobranchus ocellatus]|uniref:RNA-directed DNA polymerase from mobile element jockey n=1 Tax=Plakobranchus ocellatus TaxID=259542 RepID=A0AAV4B9G0_9GAST|nr:RNA-directed DNA polymerase from mobile element jockey [Plakobranchus ocellatus]
MDTVVQWNIRGLRSNFEELKLLLNRSQSAVVALQECRLGEGQVPPRGYTLLLPQGGSTGGEAALLIRNGTRFSEIDLKTGLHAAAATISLEKTLTVCSLYLPPSSPVSKLSLAELFEQLPKPFLVLGDFNAHSPAWGDSRRDGRGRMLEEVTAENDLIILNSGEQTFVHSAYHSTSAIDLAVASPSIAAECSWAAHSDLCGSDHFPIFLTLSSNFSSNYLKKKCLKALNLLRVVGHTDRGADRATLLKLYRTLVRSKLDYGSVIYGSAKKTRSEGPGPYTSSGPRETTPIKSLYAEAGEPSLEHRRMKLAFNYVLKLKSLPRNPCHEVVFEAPLDWDAEEANKFHEVLPNLGEDLHRRGEGAGRKLETAMFRLRVGHTWLTQSYLLKNEDQPFCYACDSLYTVRHILIECLDFQDTRKKYFSVTDLYRLFREVNPSRIVGYLKDLGVDGNI